MMVQGVPVYVNPESMLMKDTVADFMFNQKIKIGWNEVTF